MKFLSVLGQILVKGTQIITGLGPLLPAQHQSVAVKVRDTLEGVADIVVNIEVFGQVLSTPGADKLKAATPLVAQLILRSDLMTGKKINDPVLFRAGAEKVASGMADILNSIKDEEIKTESID